MTRRQDVLEAVRLGADAIGVVLYEASPRFVTPRMARELVADLPGHVERVGVFVGAAPAEIAAAVQSAELTMVQLYYGPSRSELDRAGCNVPVLRAVHADARLPETLVRLEGEAVLIDASDQKLPGGTGTTWDWSLLDHAPRPTYLMLAGGLTAHNVHEAITRVSPDAVDVSSGIESSPGIKDHARMAAFVAACAPYRGRTQESK